jgi:hypothetical protein
VVRIMADLFTLRDCVAGDGVDNGALTTDFRDGLFGASGELGEESPVTQYLGHGLHDSRFPLMESDQEVWLRGCES